MSDLPIDPILNLEEVRTNYLRLSNGAFAAIRSTLPVIRLGTRRRGIRLSDLQAWLNARLECVPGSHPQGDQR